MNGKWEGADVTVNRTREKIFLLTSLQRLKRGADVNDERTLLAREGISGSFLHPWCAPLWISPGMGDSCVVGTIGEAFSAGRLCAGDEQEATLFS